MKKTFIFILYAFIGWAWCGAIMGIGQQFMSMHTTLIVHAIGGPLGFGLLSWHYHKRFGYTTPLLTAVGFTVFVILVDFFLVALTIEKSLDMFRSPLGTWIPFALILIVTYVMGKRTVKIE
jgi:hypothetical protein